MPEGIRFDSIYHRFAPSADIERSALALNTNSICETNTKNISNAIGSGDRGSGSSHRALAQNQR
jgi:hypothetical protein